MASTPMESHEQAWKSIEANNTPGQSCTDRLESSPRKKEKSRLIVVQPVWSRAAQGAAVLILDDGWQE
jgi:hypothetical protein